MELEGFEWDSGNWSKCQKLGVTIDDIEAWFLNSPYVAPDLAHSKAEDRFIAIGKDADERMFAVVFTYRNRKIRPISARYMHASEIHKYEQQKTAKTEK